MRYETEVGAPIRYVLALLSHGNPESPFQERTVDSFVEQVEPEPVAVVAWHDGPGNAYVGPFTEDARTDVRAGGRQAGFCAATRALWRLASETAEEAQADYVFWLEHDFVFSRPVDLNELAAALDADDELAQISLMRQPVNRRERDAGSVIDALGRDRFEPIGEPARYLKHRAYFTTNPSLMPAGFMFANEFAYDRANGPQDIECEGRFGQRLIGDGYAFGVWGDGEPWVEHTGERDGKGY